MEREIYEWLVKIIDSCYHDFHFEAVDRLIIMYYEREKDEDKKHDLEVIRNKRWNEIHDILM